MLEKLSSAELEQLLTELKDKGYDIHPKEKISLVYEEMNKLGMKDAYVSSEVSKPLYMIADLFTNNYTENARGKNANRVIPTSIEPEYRRILNALLQVIKPYYGHQGFRKRK